MMEQSLLTTLLLAAGVAGILWYGYKIFGHKELE